MDDLSSKCTRGGFELVVGQRSTHDRLRVLVQSDDRGPWRRAFPRVPCECGGWAEQSPVGAPGVSFLRRGSRVERRRPRHVPALPEPCRAKPAGRDGALLLAPCARVHAMLARTAAAPRCPRRDLHGVRVLFGVLHFLGGACEAVRGDDPGTARSRLRRPGRGAGVERRLPPPALRRDGRSRSRHRSGGERRTCGRGTRSPDAGGVLRSCYCRAARRRRPERVTRAREQRAGAGARPERLRRRRRDTARTDRQCDI